LLSDVQSLIVMIIDIIRILLGFLFGIYPPDSSWRSVDCNPNQVINIVSTNTIPIIWLWQCDNYKSNPNYVYLALQCIICMWIHIHIRTPKLGIPTHTYTHTHIQPYIHTYMHACMHACMHAYLHTYLPTYLHTYIPTYLHTYLPTYLPTYLRTYVRTYVTII